MKRPLLRYTLGPVKPLGLTILRESIKKIQELYPEFEIIICHNQLNHKQLNFIKKLKVELYEQKHEGLTYKPTVENWKMYPPRLDMDRHEMAMDNDIVLMNKLDEIDRFLKSDNSTLTTEDTSRNLGKYSKFLKLRMGLNCGIYGMPPNFNFAEKIEEMCKQDIVKKWIRRYDDQGLITSAMFNHENCIIIPLLKMWILDPFAEFPKVPPDNYYGAHFVFANRSRYHRAWHEYMNRKIE